jgi:hypothetical protein
VTPYLTLELRVVAEAFSISIKVLFFESLSLLSFLL